VWTVRIPDQSAPQAAEPDPARPTSRTAAPVGPEANLINLQQTAGNAAVGRMLIQRDPAPGAPPATTETWQVKPELVPDFIALNPGPVTDRGTAASVLGLVSMRLSELKECLNAADAAPVTSAITGVDSEKQKLAAGGDLTHSDVVDLNMVVDLAKTSFDAATAKLRQSIADALTSITQGFSSTDTSLLETQLAEALHSSFVHGKTPETVEHIKKSIGTVKEYKEKADKFADWAKKGADAVKAAKASELLEKFAKGSKAFGEALGYAGTIIDSAELLYSLTSGHGGQTDAQATINGAKVALKAIDLTVGAVTELCPIFGSLWNSYYKPMTEACLQAMQKLFDIQDDEARLGSYFGVLGRWDSGLLQPPQLPTETDPDTLKIISHFPGGQPILTFMYNLVNGMEPVLTPTVEQYFVSKVDLFNAGQDEKDKMKTQSNWKLLHPSTWGADDTSPNLMSFLRNNQDNVWAQLYGALPHTLKSGH
jgi:hypothetical protein